MKRSGQITLVELLIVVAILAILVGLLGGGGCVDLTGYYNQKSAGVYQCVKAYTVTTGGGEGGTTTTKRVDLRPAAGGQVQTFICQDNYWRLGIVNSATIFGQFETGQWYSVNSVGYRREAIWWGCFPIVTNVQSVPAPKPEQ